ncbi:MAG: hypothetical protein H9W81_15010 [Enterococcus sp.]|nr:hypothetical protein [Enterococcus sp.]
MKKIFEENYLTASQFAELLEIDVKNLTYRYETKQIPEPDLRVGNQRFWFKGSVYGYFDEVRIKAEEKLEKLSMEV